MSVSRSGYYKWRERDSSEKLAHRREVAVLVREIHDAHPSHGYRWVCAYIFVNYNIKYSENYIYKAFRALGITAKTKHRAKQRKRVIKDKYPNLIFTTWNTVDRPRQVIVSDMTAFTVVKIYYELTMYFDVFTKEILSWELTDKRGDRFQYIDGLKTVIDLLDGLELNEPTIIHTDQGSVYASIAYNELISDKNIQRSMSRAGKPTDNPVNESLNGWIKEELFVDFNLAKSKDVYQSIKEYVEYYNNRRPCYSLGYETPVRYYNKYINGQLEKRDTFSKRILDPKPKYVRQKRLKKEVQVSEDDNMIEKTL